MRLSDALMENFVREVAGEHAIELFRVLRTGINISEFRLAELLGITVNQVRNMLYKLVDYNLVFFTRKKDRQKGWYIYYWTFNFKEARMLLNSIKNKKLNELKARLEEMREKKFFVCPNGDVRFSLNDAMEHNFKCPECEQILVEEENKKIIAKIENDIKALEQELKVEWEPLIAGEEEEIKEKVKKVKKVKKRIKKKRKKKLKRRLKKIKKVKKKIRKKVKVKKRKKIRKKKR